MTSALVRSGPNNRHFPTQSAVRIWGHERTWRVDIGRAPQNGAVGSGEVAYRRSDGGRAGDFGGRDASEGGCFLCMPLRCSVGIRTEAARRQAPRRRWSASSSRTTCSIERLLRGCIVHLWTASRLQREASNSKATLQSGYERRVCHFQYGSAIFRCKRQATIENLSSLASASQRLETNVNDPRWCRASWVVGRLEHWSGPLPKVDQPTPAAGRREPAKAVQVRARQGVDLGRSWKCRPLTMI